MISRTGTYVEEKKMVRAAIWKKRCLCNIWTIQVIVLFKKVVRRDHEWAAYTNPQTLIDRANSNETSCSNCFWFNDSSLCFPWIANFKFCRLVSKCNTTNNVWWCTQSQARFKAFLLDHLHVLSSNVTILTLGAQHYLKLLIKTRLI